MTCWRSRKFPSILNTFLITSNQADSSHSYNTDLVINAIGRAHGDPSHPTGPTVCAAIDGRGTNTNPLGDFIIQDGTVPEAIAGLLQPILDVVALLGTRTGRPHSSKRLQKLKAAWISRLFGPYARGGAVSKTQVLLVMSRDSEYRDLSVFSQPNVNGA